MRHHSQRKSKVTVLNNRSLFSTSLLRWVSEQVKKNRFADDEVGGLLRYLLVEDAAFLFQ